MFYELFTSFFKLNQKYENLGEGRNVQCQKSSQVFDIETYSHWNIFFNEVTLELEFTLKLI